MTSQQLKARLDEAIAIIADCERLLEAASLRHRVSDFMDLHRDEQREGGAA